MNSSAQNWIRLGSLALARSMAERIDQADMQRSWPKVASAGGRKRVAQSVIDTLPSEQQEEVVASTAAWIVAETLAESEARPEPAEESEVAAPRLVVYDETEDEPDPFAEEFDDDIPELTREILCKMFANMMAHGTWPHAV